MPTACRSPSPVDRPASPGEAWRTDGLLVALEKMDRLLDIRPDPETGGMVAVAEPGIFLGDFQRALEERGWFYPPDPTSRDEAQLGATVATNATGEDTLLYGPTRRWVRELRVVTADGTRRDLRRPRESRPTGREGYRRLLSGRARDRSHDR